MRIGISERRHNWNKPLNKIRKEINQKIRKEAKEFYEVKRDEPKRRD